MSLQAKFYKRDFSEMLRVPVGTYTPNQYSWRTVGGPYRTSVTVTADMRALWQLFDFIRCPIELWDANMRLVWWGYVHAINVRVGAIDVGISLDQMANSVRVSYALLKAGQTTAGTKSITTANSDAVSIAEFGTKQLKANVSDATEAQATQLRDIILGQRKLPLSTVQHSGAPVEGSLSALLDCRGWWETLRWKYYAKANRVESTLNGTDWQELTITNNARADYQKLGQRFRTSVASPSYKLQTVKMRLSQGGTGEASANGKVYCDLYSDSSGVPGTLIAQSDILAETSVPTDTAAYSNFSFFTPPTISPNTYYWLVVSRVDGTKEQLGVIQTQDSGYTDGSMASYNYGTGVWTYKQTYSVLFEAGLLVNANNQIPDIIADAGQFITGVDMLADPASFTSAFRDGERTALDMVEDLIRAGTSAGRNLVVTVTPERRVQIDLEPLATDPAYAIDSSGGLYDSFRNPMDRSMCPVGKWMTLRDVSEFLDYGSLMTSPVPFFVEEATYDPLSRAYKPKPRGVPNQWSVGGIKR